MNMPPQLTTPGSHKCWSNEDILIIPADKGRATVIMDREKYNTKLSTMLKDVTVYEQLKNIHLQV